MTTRNLKMSRSFRPAKCLVHFSIIFHVPHQHASLCPYAVIPFQCDDIDTCLDGYAHPPSYQDCVALGPVTSDSIRLDYNTSGPGSKKVAVSITTPSAKFSHYISITEVFLWVRKARQYLNICRTFMVDSSLSKTEG